MKTIITVIVLSLICSFGRADSDTRCRDLGGGLRIIAKISDNTYIADMWGMLTPKVRFVLMTNGTDFTKGLVSESIWVDVPIKNAEKKTVKTTEGFSETYEVAHETPSCTAQGQKMAVQVRSKEKQREKDRAANEAEARKANEEHERDDALRNARRNAEMDAN